MDSVSFANSLDKSTQTESIFLPSPYVSTELQYSSVLAANYNASKYFQPKSSIRGGLVESHSIGLLFLEYSLRYIEQRNKTVPRLSGRVLLSTFFLQFYQLNSLAEFKLNRYLESLDFYSKVPLY